MTCRSSVFCRRTADSPNHYHSSAETHAASYNAGIIVGIRAYRGRAQAVAEQLMPLNEVVYVNHVTGRFDQNVELFLRDENEMLAFLSQHLGEFPRIASIDAFHILGANKVNSDRKLSEGVVPALCRRWVDCHALGSFKGRRPNSGSASGNGRRSAHGGAT